MCSAIQPCVSRQIRTDAQGETFFAQQNVAAVTGADRDDRVVLRKMADEPPLRIDIEQRMHAAIPFRIGSLPSRLSAISPMRVMIRMLSTT